MRTRLYAVLSLVTVIAATAPAVLAGRGVTTATRTVELIEYQMAGDTEAHGVPK